MKDEEVPVSVVMQLMHELPNAKLLPVQTDDVPHVVTHYLSQNGSSMSLFIIHCSLCISSLRAPLSRSLQNVVLVILVLVVFALETLCEKLV